MSPSPGDGVNKVEQHSGVAFHRAANIADKHQRAWLVLGLTAGQFQQLAPVFEVAAESPAQVQGSAFPGY
jgi:hypothetical protein